MKTIILLRLTGFLSLSFLLHFCSTPTKMHENFNGCWKIFIPNSNQDSTEREYGLLKFISGSKVQEFQLKQEYHIRYKTIHIAGDSLFFEFENQPFQGKIVPEKKGLTGQQIHVKLHYIMILMQQYLTSRSTLMTNRTVINQLKHYRMV